MRWGVHGSYVERLENSFGVYEKLEETNYNDRTEESKRLGHVSRRRDTR